MRAIQETTRTFLRFMKIGVYLVETPNKLENFQFSSINFIVAYAMTIEQR